MVGRCVLKAASGNKFVKDFASIHTNCLSGCLKEQFQRKDHEGKRSSAIAMLISYDH